MYRISVNVKSESQEFLEIHKHNEPGTLTHPDGTRTSMLREIQWMGNDDNATWELVDLSPMAVK